MARKSTNYIVIHCSQTKPSMDIGAKEIDRWHRERGWLKIGYHKVITRKGEIQNGRGIDEIAAHVRDYNHNSIGICLVGGCTEEDVNKEQDNYTGEQFDSLKKLLTELVKNYPEAKIVGHRDLDKKKFCPSIEISEYLRNEQIPNYKFQEEGILTEGDLNELRETGEV